MDQVDNQMVLLQRLEPSGVGENNRGAAVASGFAYA
jgi:hypothetical protein